MKINRRTMFILIAIFLALLFIPPILNRDAWVYYVGGKHDKSSQVLANQTGWQLDPLQTEPGIVLPGLVHPAQDDTSPWVLFLPGNGGGQLEGGQSYLEQLVSADQNNFGWGLAVWAMRGYDETLGAPNARGFRTDYLAIYHHLRNTYGLQAKNIHLVGFSFGTDLAIQLAADIARVGETPGSITLLSTQGMTASTWEMRRKAWFYRWLPVDKYDLSTAFGLIDSPVLIVEAEADLHGPIAFLINMLKNKPKYLQIPGGDHSTSRKHKRALEAVRQWINLHSTTGTLDKS